MKSRLQESEMWVVELWDGTRQTASSYGDAMSLAYRVCSGKRRAVKVYKA